MADAKVVVARKVADHNGSEYLEYVYQSGPECFELVRHTLEPYGTYLHDLTLRQFQEWKVECPEQVTLIRAH
jgi:hypothetical protein